MSRFVIAGCDTAELLGFGEEAFDAPALLICDVIVGARYLAMPPWRNDGVAALLTYEIGVRLFSSGKWAPLSRASYGVTQRTFRGHMRQRCCLGFCLGKRTDAGSIIGSYFPFTEVHVRRLATSIRIVRARAVSLATVICA